MESERTKAQPSEGEPHAQSLSRATTIYILCSLFWEYVYVDPSGACPLVKRKGSYHSQCLHL